MKNGLECNIVTLKARNNARLKSVTTQLVIYQDYIAVNEISEINWKEIKKRVKKAIACITMAGALTIGAASIGAIGYGGYQLYNATVGEYFKANSILEKEMVNANTLLVENRLNSVPVVLDDQTKVWNNNYAYMQGLTEDNLYGMALYVGADEAEKMLPNLGYQNWDDFFIKNGFVDQYGKPNSDMWLENQMQRLTEKYSNEKGVQK